MKSTHMSFVSSTVKIDFSILTKLFLEFTEIYTLVSPYNPAQKRSAVRLERKSVLVSILKMLRVCLWYGAVRS